MYFLPILVAILGISLFLTWRSYRNIKDRESPSTPSEGVLLAIEMPKENEKLPVAAESLFASLHGILRFTPETQEHLSIEMASSIEGIRFYVYTPPIFRHFVESQIYAQYPDAEIKEVTDYTQNLEDGSRVATCELTLAKDFIFPIKTFRDFEVDPLAAVTSALGNLNPNERVWVQILIRPVEDFWQERGHDYVKMVKEGIEPVTLDPKEIAINVGKSLLSVGMNAPRHFFYGPLGPPDERAAARPQYPRLSEGEELVLKMIENKLSKMGFEVKIRLLAASDSKDEAERKLSSIGASFNQFTTANMNGFMVRDGDAPKLEDFRKRAFTEQVKGEFILNTEELASIFHLPNLSVETPTIAWTKAKKAEPPLDLPTTDATFVGETIFRDHKVKFGIRKNERRKHMYIIGKTGTGKTTLLKNMIIQDMRNGEGVGVLDPHGQLIDELLDFVPEERVADVVIFNPADADYPVALNMLEILDPKQRSLMGDSLVDVFKKYFAESWGPRLEYILKNCILTLLEVPNTSLLSVPRLLLDEDYQGYIVSLIKDPQMKDFWNKEFKQMKRNERLFTEAISPIQNKVGQFLNSELIRNIVGQPKSTIKLDDIINKGKIFFVNLATGRVGENNTSLLGAMIVSQLQFAAMRRVDIPEEERRDFFLYADEFQKFATDSFATVLSEARKYRLDLTLTHQYIEQMPEKVKEAVFGNIGSLLVFTVGPTDAYFLEKEFLPTFDTFDLINLGKYEMYLKLQIEDMISSPFSAGSLPPPTDGTNARSKAIETSRINFSRQKEKVERMIRKWSETRFRSGQAPQPPAWAQGEKPSPEAPIEQAVKEEGGIVAQLEEIGTAEREIKGRTAWFHPPAQNEPQENPFVESEKTPGESGGLITNPKEQSSNLEGEIILPKSKD